MKLLAVTSSSRGAPVCDPPRRRQPERTGKFMGGSRNAGVAAAHRAALHPRQYTAGARVCDPPPLCRPEGARNQSRHVGRTAGILLIQCVVYIAVFAILTAIGFAAFYLCWDDSKAVVHATDDIGSALRAGERWRADIRSATGKITVEPSAAGEQVRIPGREKAIVYRFESGGLYREIPALQTSQLVLPKVNASQMREEMRGGVTVWRWELDVSVRRPETHLPLLFTFEAAQTKP